MHISKNLSIRRKQMLIMMATSSVALLLACAVISLYEVFAFRDTMRENLVTLADIVDHNTFAALDFDDPQAAGETLAALQADPSIVGAWLYRKNGEVLAKYDRPNDNIIFTPPELRPNGTLFQGQRLVLNRPVVHKGEVIGTLYLEADMQALYGRLLRFAWIMGLVFVASLLFAFGLSNRLQRLVSDPILHLAQVARSVAGDKNYSLRAKKQSDDELGQLVDGFNEMLAQILQRDAALESARVGLETRVIERTAELAKANAALLLENTERKRAEESLLLLGTAIDQTKESIVITDAELDLPGPKIIFVNPAFTKMTGYNEAEVIGKTPRILHGPRTDRALLDRLRENLGHGRVFEGEAVNYRKDGTEFDLEWQIAPLRNAGGKITHFVAIQHDITRRKQLEAKLFQSQKLETVGKLAGGIAHEFNSILTAIIGQSELLLGDLPAGSPLAHNATEITKAANRAATLTRQLLAYGRKQILKPEILDLNSVLTGMETTLRHVMGRDADVRLSFGPGLKAVKADAGQMEQVIMNMVINASDAMPNGGKLVLETVNTVFDDQSVGRYPELKPGHYVMLAITDTGTGMSDEVKTRVFEPFFTTKDVGQGTGLGLSTCYGIIKQSGGHISVYSEPGRGTSFKIYLPQVESRAQPSVVRLDSPDLPGGTETILLAEDDPALREMAATLLRRLGYNVLTATNGVEALSLKHQRNIGHIDLLFTDVVMPHMSGKELADRMQAMYPRTKILFTSAYTENAIVHQGVLPPGVTLLQKPFTPSALANKLREVLDRPDVPKSEDA
ncbi:MAG TPA: PAS domain S-box protein [Verrucomicrobiae bacterium]|nr:PAS domain S-box protein [Verrucomicrobiae bacterium]